MHIEAAAPAIFRCTGGTLNLIDSSSDMLVVDPAPGPINHKSTNRKQPDIVSPQAQLLRRRENRKKGLLQLGNSSFTLRHIIPRGTLGLSVARTSRLTRMTSCKER